MDSAFITIVQKIVAEQGKEALLDTKKCKDLLGDYTNGEHKKESNLFLHVLGSGCQNEIATTSDIENVRLKIVRQLVDEYFLLEQAANDVVDLLCLVLRGRISANRRL